MSHVQSTKSVLGHTTRLYSYSFPITYFLYKAIKFCTSKFQSPLLHVFVNSVIANCLAFSRSLDLSYIALTRLEGWILTINFFLHFCSKASMSFSCQFLVSRKKNCKWHLLLNLIEFDENRIVGSKKGGDYLSFHMFASFIILQTIHFLYDPQNLFILSTKPKRNNVFAESTKSTIGEIWTSLIVVLLE